MKGKFKGSITVFMALLMGTIIMLVLVIVESVRVALCVEEAERVTYMGLDSCFGMYAKEVLDEYGVMFLWSGEKQFVDDFNYIVNENCDVKRNIAKIKPVDSRIDYVEHCTDCDGEVFEKQVCDFMKLKLGEDAIKLLLEKKDMLAQSDDINKMYKHISDCSKDFLETEARVSIIAGDIKDVKSKDCDLNKHITSISENSESYGHYELWKNSTIKSMERIKSDIEEFYKVSAKSKDSADEMLGSIEEMRGKTDDDTYAVIYAQAKEIADKYNENDSYGIEACKKAVEEQKRILENTDAKVKEFYNMPENKQALEEAALMGQEFDIGKILINYDVTSEKKEKNTIVKNVNDMLTSGILHLVVGDTSKISDKKISVENLPSKNISSKKRKTGLTSKLIFDQYIMDFFGCYVETKQDTALDYEIEYIINGKEDDSVNLGMTAEKIISARSGFNVISIMKDKVKMEETFALASSIAGASGNPLIIKLTQLGIIVAWASAESVADVKNLMSQKKVALIKDASQWNLSLSGIINIKSVEKKDDDTLGLSYTDYLRYLLSVQNHVVSVNRTMDLIEVNMKKKYNPDFRLADCISKVKIACVYNATPLFCAPRISKLYEIKVSQKYNY